MTADQVALYALGRRHGLEWAHLLLSLVDNDQWRNAQGGEVIDMMQDMVRHALRAPRDGD